MLIFVLQEIFRITKKKEKRKKKNFGENLKPYKVPNQLLWKISVLSHHVDFSYRYTWTWKTLSTKRTVFFYIDLHEHKKKTFGILQSYLTIKLREQKKYLECYNLTFLWICVNRKKPIWNSTTYIPVLAQQHTCI